MSRVLLLCEFATLNGGERSMLATLDGIREAGFSIAAAAPPAGPLAETLRRRDMEVEPFSAADETPDGTSSQRRMSPGRMREELAALVARQRPDLVHANSLAMGRLSGPVVAALGIPSVAHLRDILRLSRQAVADLNCHTRLLAVSRATRSFHLAQGLDPQKCRVLYNGVDLGEFCRRPRSGYLHRELALPPDARLVGTIGQIGPRKGQDVLARAAARIVCQRPDIHFLIVGERYSGKLESREFEKALQGAAARMPGRFHLLGVRGDVARLLGELDLLVHPARQEPLGRVLLEAAVAAVPVVATDVGGTREIFPPRAKSALLVPPGDPEALAAAIERVLCDPGLAGRLALRARRRAEQMFDARKTTRRLLALYRSVIHAQR